MDIMQKARILGDAGRYDSCGPKECEVRVNNSLGGLYHARSENPDCIMLKTLMNNSCSFDCKYCPNSTRCEIKNKVSYRPDELNSLFQKLRKSHGVKGLFLSSGISGDPDKATEKMLEAVREVRKTFSGYIHFKVLPGTSFELVKQASEISNRMSINIEAPNKSVLDELSTTKRFKEDILRRQAWMKNLKVNQSTQMIVNELSNDRDVVSMMDWEYHTIGLRRVYYSAFRPVKGTPMQNDRPESKKREARLYNVDVLMRSYGYKKKDFLSVMDKGMLPKEDPKVAIARANFSGAIDVNEASYEELIRIPGIGPKSAERIRDMKIRKLTDLKRIGVRIDAASPFISISGERQNTLAGY